MPKNFTKKSIDFMKSSNTKVIRNLLDNVVKTIYKVNTTDYR